MRLAEEASGWCGSRGGGSGRKDERVDESCARIPQRSRATRASSEERRAAHSDSERHEHGGRARGTGTGAHNGRALRAPRSG